MTRKDPSQNFDQIRVSDSTRSESVIRPDPSRSLPRLPLRVEAPSRAPSRACSCLLCPTPSAPRAPPAARWALGGATVRPAPHLQHDCGPTRVSHSSRTLQSRVRPART